MKKLQIIISFLLFIFAFSIEAKSPPPGTGKADVPANIYIMLDTSGSMGRSVNSQGRMYYPRDVTVDSNGNIYVVEYYYHRIRKYDSAGNFVKTFGSYGRNSNGRFYYPHKIDIDSNDNLYIADRYRIQKFNANGSWMKSFPNLSGIRNVAVDSSGNVFATNARDIYKWNSAGVSLGGVSCGQDCRGLSEYNGTIYATDQGSRPQSVKKWNASTFAPSGSFSVTRNSYPQEIEVTSKGIYVSNSLNSVQKYSLSGVYSKQFGSSSIYGFGSDSSNNIYIADFYRHAIKKYDSDGNYLSTAGPSNETRMSEVLKVIEKLTSSSDLTRGANFGLQDWSSSAIQRVPISINGAGAINLSVSPKITVGGVEKTNPDYKGNSWYHPSGGTNLDASMTEAQRYFEGTHGKKSPIDSSAGCQKNFLIVISDGQWSGSKSEKIAKHLLDTKGIETLVIGFHSGGNQTNYIKLAKAGGTYPESPLFSNNWQQLYETMSAYIRQAISSRLTFSAPVVMPNISSGDHIFQSTFEYKNDHQWKGQLAKFALTATGDVGAQKWEAGALLDQKSESSRKIWTVANTFGVNHSLNNFKTFYAADLGRAFSENSGTNPTTVQTNKLINFVRGLDAYDEDADNNSTEKRWKLGDIYNSRLIVVGSPKARTTDKSSKSDTVAYYRHLNGYDNFKKGTTCGGSCLTRKEVVYVGANDGMLHAFDSTTGEELWAFIPPTMLQDLDKMVSVKANKSNSIYGVDGSPIAKDIFYNNKWRTVLFTGMGKGGKGYFALDITNPTSPTFLFAFENKASMDLIYHWDSSGTRTDLGYAGGIAAEYDYSKLGESLSTPIIVAMPDGNNTKWVAVFGAGYNAGISTKYGSSIYVVDLEEDGKVLKRIDLADANSSNSIVNSMPADLVSITPDTTSKANYKGSMVYGADLEGKMWKLNLTNKDTLYEITPYFNAEATLDNDRSVFFQVTPSIGADNKLWNFYGTGNQQRLQTLSSSINNRIFGIKDSKFPVYENVNGLTTTAQSSLKNMSTPGGTCPTTNDLGWYVNLGSNERITGKLALFNETIYATKYKPNQGAICSPGTAYLDELSMGCGKVNRTTNLGEGIATGAVIYKNKIYIGISGSGSGDLKDDQGKVVGKKVNNIIVINPAAGNTVGGGNITQESWREIF